MVDKVPVWLDKVSSCTWATQAALLGAAHQPPVPPRQPCTAARQAGIHNILLQGHACSRMGLAGTAPLAPLAGTGASSSCPGAGSGACPAIPQYQLCGNSRV